jgi:TatD DNase family protein
LKKQALIMHFIDTHCHIYLEDFDVDREDMLKRSLLSQVKKHHLPAINSETHDRMMQLEEKYPEICIPMMGLHPCYVKEDFETELEKVKNWLQKRQFCAIGECGLDLYWDKTFYAQQEEALIQQIKWSKEYELPLVLHTRNATRETIDIVRKHHFDGIKGIFHCFGGNIEEANDIIKMGFYLGIGGVVTYKNAGLDAVIKDISLEHIVLETDAPYLAPVPNRGKRNEPSMLTFIAEKISQIKGISIEEVAQITSENASNIFNYS